MNETKKKYLCGSANCMNKGYFKYYLVKWFYGGEYSKNIFRYVLNASRYGKIQL